MSRLAAVVLAAYAFHFIWEMAQASLYEPMRQLPFWRATVWCARAAAWDVLISAAAYAAAAATARQVVWVHRAARLPFATYFAVGMAVTVAIEKWATADGRWDYEVAMPTVAGIGLTPLLQWIVVPGVIVLIIRVLTRRAGPRHLRL